MNRSLILGGLALLLLLGCAGRPGYQAPAQPSPASSGMQIGDSDIAPQPTVNESDTLSNEPVVPPDNGSTAEAGNSTPANGSQNLSAGSFPNDSDLLVDNTTNEDLISQQDVVEPP